MKKERYTLMDLEEQILVIVGVASWTYEDLGALIVEGLNLNPCRGVEGDISGDRPVRYLCEAANRIARGERLKR